MAISCIWIDWVVCIFRTSVEDDLISSLGNRPDHIFFIASQDSKIMEVWKKCLTATQGILSLALRWNYYTLDPWTTQWGQGARVTEVSAPHTRSPCIRGHISPESTSQDDPAVPQDLLLNESTWKWVHTVQTPSFQSQHLSALSVNYFIQISSKETKQRITD